VRDSDGLATRNVPTLSTLDRHLAETVDTGVPYLDITDNFSMSSDAVVQAREQSWYARTNYGLAILRYDEVSRLLKDRRLRQGSAAWPARNGVSSGPFVDWWSDAVLSREGDEHARLRRLLNPAFARSAVTSLVPRFQALGNELIDAFIERGECEFVTDFAAPYASRVVALLLGFPQEQWRSVAGWSEELGLALSVTIKEDLPRVEAALAALFEFADELIEERRRSPHDDFLAGLVAATGRSDGLSERELRDAVVLLIFGGIDTTRNQLGLAMTVFMEHLDQWELLGREPELGAKAVEEVMRVRPTVTWVTREAAEDFEFQGLAIEEGTTIHLFSQSAGSDPRTFGQAGFDIAADRPPHFGFGGGIHHCLGHFVARADMSAALPLLAQRLHEPRLAGRAAFLPESGNTGAIRLPIAFAPSSGAGETR
jgi:cytochrome P450